VDNFQNMTIIGIAAVLLGSLLFFEKGKNRKGIVPTKTVLSALFVAAAIIQPHPIQSYFVLVLAGLLFCLGGDVCLALPQQKAFLFGLILFLLGHVLYIAAFLEAASFSGLPWLPVVATLGISTGVYLWLRPHLGRMHGPVVAYVTVITIMVCVAWGFSENRSLDISGRRLALIGAISFYLSDLFVARNRFLQESFLNRLVGLPTYYAGQFLLAFSVGLLK
jgi:uncharacterized membrane protein YhhN